MVTHDDWNDEWNDYEQIPVIAGRARKPRHPIRQGTPEYNWIVYDDPIAERFKDAIWADFAKAAIQVGCASEVAESLYEDFLQACLPFEMQYRPRRRDIGILVDEAGRLLNPDELEKLRWQYRAALTKLHDNGVDCDQLTELAAEWRAWERGERELALPPPPEYNRDPTKYAWRGPVHPAPVIKYRRGVPITE